MILYKAPFSKNLINTLSIEVLGCGLMSAEKEVINFWLNRKGYFTVNNIKSGNKDVGILALRFDKGILKQIMHVEIICSISGFVEQNQMGSIIEEKFQDKNVMKTIENYTKNISKEMDVEKIIVVSSLPKDKKAAKLEFEKKGIGVMEFEDILSDVMKEMKTEYFKNDTIRTVQIFKYLLMSNPKNLVDVLYNTLGQAKIKEFLAELLSREEIIKEFKKTNEERLALILKQAMLKPERLAEMLEKGVLNRKTRKPFIASLMEQEKLGVEYKKQIEAKKEKPLSKFFV